MGAQSSVFNMNLYDVIFQIHFKLLGSASNIRLSDNFGIGLLFAKMDMQLMTVEARKILKAFSALILN